MKEWRMEGRGMEGEKKSTTIRMIKNTRRYINAKIHMKMLFISISFLNCSSRWLTSFSYTCLLIFSHALPHSVTLTASTHLFNSLLLWSPLWLWWWRKQQRHCRRFVRITDIVLRMKYRRLFVCSKAYIRKAQARVHDTTTKYTFQLKTLPMCSVFCVYSGCIAKVID